MTPARFEHEVEGLQVRPLLCESLDGAQDGRAIRGLPVDVDVDLGESHLTAVERSESFVLVLLLPFEKVLIVSIIRELIFELVFSLHIHYVALDLVETWRQILNDLGWLGSPKED